MTKASIVAQIFLRAPAKKKPEDDSFGLHELRMQFRDQFRDFCRDMFMLLNTQVISEPNIC